MNEAERVHLEKNLYIAGLILPCAGALLFLLQKLLPSALLEILSVPCLLHAVTGLHCPGCGGTRAAGYLLQGKPFLSFLYHPIVPYGAALYLWFMLSHTVEYLSGHRIRIGMRYRNGYLYFALALVFLNLVVKNVALAAFGVDLLDKMYV